MPLIFSTATLLLIDLQTRLVPAIDGAAALLANARLLTRGAGILGLPVVVTEQYPKGLGPSLPDLIPDGGTALPKTTFDATATPRIADRLAQAGPLIVAGCETHVCVLQTVLSLRALGHDVFVVADATGSRTAANHAAALTRMAAHGAEIVTTEMVLFETMRSAEHPAFRQISALVK